MLRTCNDLYSPQRAGRRVTIACFKPLVKTWESLSALCIGQPEASVKVD